MSNRRSVIAAGIGATFCRALPAYAQVPTPVPPPASRMTIAQAADALTALEATHGGRLGVAAFDTGSGRTIGHRADERFALCSTHKFLTTAGILALVDQHKLSLDQRISYSLADLLAYAPITRQNVAAGFMTVDALCAAAIEWSDNTAANLLLRLLGGPSGWTSYARSLGDHVSRLDRIEPALNSAIPRDIRDTTSPAAMAHDLDRVLVGGALSQASRVRLENWMLDGKITGSLLRADLPYGWRVGDKSGTGDHDTRNDIGIMLPPHAAPILAAVYYTESTEPASSRERVIAEVGDIIAKTFTPTESLAPKRSSADILP